jgi:hypothetical protein
MRASTAAKYSNGERSRCRTRVRTGPLPRRQGLPIPGPERSSGAAEQEECSSFQSCPTCPAVGVQRAGVAVSRLTLPLMQAVSLGWSCPSPPGSRRCSWTRWAPPPGAALRAEGLSSRRAPRRPFAPRPVHHRRRACAAPWRTPARRECSARRANRHMAGALAQSGQVPGCRGPQAADGTAG